MRRFEPKDYKQLKSWYDQRGIAAPAYDFIPGVGFIVDKVAAGFMILTELPYAILDLYISNPHADKDHRKIALDHITQALIFQAKSMDCRIVRCETQIGVTKSVAKRNGFKSRGDYSLYSMELK